MPDVFDWRRSRIPVTSPALVCVLIALGIAVGLLPWQTTLFGLLTAVAFWMGMRRPDWGLGFLALTIPMQTHVKIGIPPENLTWTKVVVWSLLAGWSVSLLLSRQRVRIDFVTVATFVLVGVLALTVWNARDHSLWLAETYRWLVTAFVASLAFNTFRRGGSPLPLLLGSVAGVGASVCLAAWQVLFGVGPESFDVRGYLRGYGPFTHPNQLALYLETTIPLFLALAIGSTGRLSADRQWFLRDRFRLLWSFGFAVGMTGLILSQSRGGFVGMAAGLTTVLVLRRPGWRLTLVRLAPFAAIGAIALLTIAIGMVGAGMWEFSSGETLVTPANFAVQERLSHWTAAVEMAKAHPLLGIGAGNYDDNYRDFTQVWRFRIGRGHAHDTYLHFLAQSGVAGLAAYIALLIGVILIIVRTLRILPEGTRATVVIGAAGITVAICAHAVFEYAHVLSLNLQLVMVWAMALSIGTEAWNERANGGRVS